MSELDDLRSFVEVVESGGFGRAAQRLNVSKSIVSRRIARLEAELGTRLLSRTTRGISPTGAGLEFNSVRKSEPGVRSSPACPRPSFTNAIRRRQL